MSCPQGLKELRVKAPLEMSWLCLNLNIVLEDLFVITIGFIDDNFV